MTRKSAPRGNHLYNTAVVSKEAFLSVEFETHTTERIIAIEGMKGAERVAQLDIWTGSKSSTMECTGEISMEGSELQNFSWAARQTSLQGLTRDVVRGLSQRTSRAGAFA